MSIESPMRVLVAEDNDTNIAVLSTMLEAFGCEIHLALDGQKAVDGALEWLPDIILMDINMPNKDGVQAAIDIRARLPDPRIPIVAVTGNVTRSSRQRCEDAGFDGFIEKPIDIVVLQEVLEKADRDRQVSGDAV
ncbi:response regulator [Minwuia sp.]|uniref:response regulator n=1 Tax=Minwuia sp. TaxID=2493630 RepID=UPI003A9261D2